MVVAPDEPRAEAFWRRAGYAEHAGARRYTKTL
jgi:hypothetical protein